MTFDIAHGKRPCSMYDQAIFSGLNTSDITFSLIKSNTFFS